VISPTTRFKSSIEKKQIVAATGLVLIGFAAGHLAGNLFIYLGPEAFNGYAKKLSGLRPGLYLVEAFLSLLFIIHLWFTSLLAAENSKARPVRYHMAKDAGDRSLAARLMPLTGTIIILFIIWHLKDFTFSDQHGARSILADGKSYGLYGVVYNSFLDPIHCVLYILAMAALGFHLTHGIQSFVQTFGFDHPRYTPVVRKISRGLGLLISLAYSSIPIGIQLGWLGVK
jgi:succinate dehydrogenase / fumarate reductase cytochrome b subunit